jgi:hypothetical protein
MPEAEQIPVDHDGIVMFDKSFLLAADQRPALVSVMLPTTKPVSYNQLLPKSSREPGACSL